MKHLLFYGSLPADQPVEPGKTKAKVDNKKEVDMLKLIDLRKHTTRGTWSKADGYISAAEIAAMVFPVATAKNYTYTVEFTVGKRDGIWTLVFPVGDARCQFWVWQDGGRPNVCGVSDVNNIDPRYNGSRTVIDKLNTDHRYKMEVATTVTSPKKASFTVTLDRVKLYTWTGDPKELKVSPVWRWPS